MEDEIVWLTEERTFAKLIRHGAHYSVVEYVRNGMEYEEVIENDEFKFVELWSEEHDDDEN